MMSHAGFQCWKCLGILQKCVPREQDYRIFSASLDNTLRLWDPHDLRCLRHVTDALSEVSSMTFCEEEDLVVTGNASLYL